MKVLLTGATGMVGRNILDHDLAKKYDWICPNSAELNLLDGIGVDDFISRKKPDLIIHAAGKVGGIQANIKEPVNYLVENLNMGQNVLLAAKKHNIVSVLNLGSSCMYPKNKETHLVEEDILAGELEPTNEGYALAKIVVAKLAAYISVQNSSLQYKTIIPCNLYGKHDNFNPGRSHMIPAVIHKLHHAKENHIDVVDIWGTGDARREFMYAGDLADAIMYAIENIEAMPQYLNVGLGYDFSVNEYYKIAADIIGFSGTFEHDLSKPVGMKRKLVAVDKATTWGWHAKTSLQDGLEKTYQYYLEQQ